MTSKRADISLFVVRRLAIHEIPQHRVGEEGDGPRLSEAESPLSREVRNFFRERIIKVLSENAYSVRFDPASDSPVPGLIQHALAPRANFLSLSQDMARHLYACQQGWSPPGLLAAILGHIGDHPAVAVLKLEKEEGTRVRSEIAKGKSFFSVEHVKDLILTGKTRIFKVGLFAASEAEVMGLACDQQRPPGHSVAQFFLHEFLGCALEERAEVSTQRFFNAAERFFNDEVEEPELRSRYQLALLSELNSEADRIRPERFAQEHLQVRHRDPFMDRVRLADVPTAFPKSVDLVRRRLPRVQLTFEKGTAVLSPPEETQAGGSVKLEQVEGGELKVTITDRLKMARGHS